MFKKHIEIMATRNGEPCEARVSRKPNFYLVGGVLVSAEDALSLDTPRSISSIY